MQKMTIKRIIKAIIPYGIIVFLQKNANKKKKNAFSKTQPFSFKDSENNFHWTSKSVQRNKLTEIFEPFQPFIFMSTIKRLAGKSTCKVFDIGSNIGIYSLFSASLQCVDKVFAFEAEESSYKHLIENINENEMGNKIEAHFVAVSNKNGKVLFGIRKEMGGDNGILETLIHDKQKYIEKRDIPSISLDSKFNFVNDTIALKIDVEGHEEKVINGASNLLKRNKCFIQLELYKDQGNIISILNNLGYSMMFNIGHDHYFSNYEVIIKKEKGIEILTEVMSNIIHSNLSKI